MRPVGDWPVALTTMRVRRLPAPRSCPDAHHSPSPILLPKPNLSMNLCTKCNGTRSRRDGRDVGGRKDLKLQVCQGQRDDRRLATCAPLFLSVGETPGSTQIYCGKGYSG